MYPFAAVHSLNSKRLSAPAAKSGGGCNVAKAAPLLAVRVQRLASGVNMLAIGQDCSILVGIVVEFA